MKKGLPATALGPTRSNRQRPTRIAASQRRRNVSLRLRGRAEFGRPNLAGRQLEQPIPYWMVAAREVRRAVHERKPLGPDHPGCDRRHLFVYVATEFRAAAAEGKGGR